MKIHPEMAEIVKQEMQAGMRYWKNESPEEILDRIRKRVLAEQAPLQQLNVANKVLSWDLIYDCNCLKYAPSHVAWCDAKSRVQLKVQENLNFKVAPTDQIPPRKYYGLGGFYGY